MAEHFSVHCILRENSCGITYFFVVIHNRSLNTLKENNGWGQRATFLADLLKNQDERARRKLMCPRRYFNTPSWCAWVLKLTPGPRAILLTEWTHSRHQDVVE